MDHINALLLGQLEENQTHFSGQESLNEFQRCLFNTLIKANSGYEEPDEHL